MKKQVITNSQARRLALAHHGLYSPYEFHGKEGVLEYIKRIGCIQFDPLNIVGRNPELVLQARIEDFRSSMLDELLYQERQLLDGLDKEMSIYCVQDWPYFQRHRDAALQRFGNDKRPVVPFLPQVRQEIERIGPLSSSGLNLNQIVDWPWAPTRLSRAALESMYLWGELIIHHKENTRKVYDFAHRHLAEELLTDQEPNETEKEYYDWYVLRRLGAVGLLWGKSGDAWRSIYGLHSAERQASLSRLIRQGKVVQLSVEGIKYPLYMRTVDKQRIITALASNNLTPRATILAPLDNLLWDRQLTKELFNFEYRWEVYKPIEDRQYGYYVLPVLHDDRFIARFEPGREKQGGALVIKNWWWESGVTPSEEMRAALRECFERFLVYLGTDIIKADRAIVRKERLDWLPRRDG